MRQRLSSLQENCSKIAFRTCSLTRMLFAFSGSLTHCFTSAIVSPIRCLAACHAREIVRDEYTYRPTIKKMKWPGSNCFSLQWGSILEERMRASSLSGDDFGKFPVFAWFLRGQVEISSLLLTVDAWLYREWGVFLKLEILGPFFVSGVEYEPHKS